MAGMVDVKTGQIIGAEPGTLAYFHEVGHILYSKNSVGMRASFYMESFIVLTLATLVLNLWFSHIYFKVLPTVCVVLFYVLYFFEELVCWIYAYQRMGSDEKRKMIFGLEWQEKVKEVI